MVELEFEKSNVSQLSSLIRSKFDDGSLADTNVLIVALKHPNFNTFQAFKPLRIETSNFNFSNFLNHHDSATTTYNSIVPCPFFPERSQLVDQIGQRPVPSRQQSNLAANEGSQLIDCFYPLL